MSENQSALTTRQCPRCGATAILLQEGLRDKNEIPIHQPDGTTIYLIHPVFVGADDPTIVMTNSCMEIVREYGPLRGGFTAPSSNIPPEFRDESMANN